MTKWRALIAACGLLLAAVAFRVFYIRELFFAFLLFAIAYLLLLFLVAALFCALYVYARGMVYFAVRIRTDGHRALLLFRVLCLWLVTTVTHTATHTWSRYAT